MSDDSNLFYKMVDWDKRLDREKDFFHSLVKDFKPEENNVLDLGCGIGHHLILLASWGYFGYGIDFSEESIELALKRIKEYNLEHLLNSSFGDMRYLHDTIGDKKFDLVVCLGNSFALFSPEERQSILKQAVASLKPSGKIVIQVVNYFKNKDKSVWTINPKVFRENNGLISFFVRILEWINKDKEKVRMYVQRLKQKEKNLEDFEQSQKTTEFFAVREEDFGTLREDNSLKLRLFGDFNYSSFDEEKSNDLIILIEKKDK